MTCFSPRCYFCQIYAGRLNRRNYKSNSRQTICCKVNQLCKGCSDRNNTDKKCCRIPNRRYQDGYFDIGEPGNGFGPSCRDLRNYY